jgi:hypothetical protein
MTTSSRAAMWRMGPRLRSNIAYGLLAVAMAMMVPHRAFADLNDIFKRYGDQYSEAITNEQKADVKKRFLDELTSELALRQSARQSERYLTEAGASCVVPSNEYVHCFQSSIRTYNDHVAELYQTVTTWGVEVKFSAGKIVSIDVQVKLIALQYP